jgi:hypothetical protein
VGCALACRLPYRLPPRLSFAVILAIVEVAVSLFLFSSFFLRRKKKTQKTEADTLTPPFLHLYFFSLPSVNHIRRKANKKAYLPCASSVCCLKKKRKKLASAFTTASIFDGIEEQLLLLFPSLLVASFPENKRSVT